MKVVSTSFAISIGAGLPNIIGRVGGTKDVIPNGAFYFTGNNFAGNTDIVEHQFKNTYMNASLSNSIYGSSNMVTPLSLSTSYILKY